ncbi:MAG: RNA-directed DNA polymerase [Candidatus Heimdallarchaeota archaeon]|nr:RNA-directed DNA polymerase [Candidatus Heimdallarchaeota archaeon]
MIAKKKVKKSKIEKLPVRVKKMLNIGLWSYEVQVPDDQTLERLHLLDRDIIKRKKDIHIPETGKKQIYRQAEKQYDKHSSKKRSERKKLAPIRQIKKKEDWEEFKKVNFVHLGTSVSNWLNLRVENTDKLNKVGLPSISDSHQLAKLLGISIAQIKYFAYHRKSSQVNHYVDFYIPKGKRGRRLISRPKKELENIQSIIKKEILDKISFSDAVFGFIPGKSHINNAQEHVKRDFIINIDIQDFFPSTNFYKVRSIFRNLGYSGEISSVLALLTTKQDTRSITIGEDQYHTFTENRYLPQGACTSPTLSNLALVKVDNQLIKRSIELGYKYSRYVDDLTFSINKPISKIKTLLYMVRKTLEYHGYEANPHKTKILGKNNSQNITGLVINSGESNVPRYWRRRLRAAVHQFQYIKDDEIKSIELVRLLGCINYLKISHSRLAQNYFELVTKYYQ